LVVGTGVVVAALAVTVFPLNISFNIVSTVGGGYLRYFSACFLEN